MPLRVFALDLCPAAPRSERKAGWLVALCCQTLCIFTLAAGSIAFQSLPVYLRPYFFTERANTREPQRAPGTWLRLTPSLLT